MTTSQLSCHRLVNGYTDANSNKSGDSQLMSDLSFMESSGQVPRMSDLRQLIHKLDLNDADFVEEQEMQSLKQKVITQIRRNRDLEAKIEEADRRIGSLVRNCQLVTSRLLMQGLKEEAPVSRGVSDFSQEGRDKLAKYEQLFYLLQTRPEYLTQLLVHESLGRLSSVQKTCIYNLFAYCITIRESYLLLNLFKTMLQEETRSLIKDPREFMNGDPLTINLAVDFYRSTCISSLFASIKPLISEIIHARHVSLSIDPVSIYKTWIKDMEAESGHAMTNYPYSVTADQALAYPEVEDLLNKAVNNLIRAANRFMEIFARQEFIQEVPYGVRFLTRHLWQLVSSKFPATSQRDLLKMTADVIYYRFIGSCIICPEVYGLIKLRAGERITCEARSNLGNISKLLSAAASGSKSSLLSLSDIDSYKSMALTTFLNNAHETFVEFFRAVLLIQQPEDYFEVNQFSEEALISPPQITLKLKEIVDMHQWIHDSRQLIAPDPEDEMNEILNQLGPPPSHASQIVNHGHGTIGRKVPTYCNGVLLDQQETQITLTLKNRKAVTLNPEETISSKKIKVKQAIVELIRHGKSCRDLNEVLFRKIEIDEEESYRMSRKRLAKETTAYFRTQSIIFSPHGQSLKTLADYVRLNTQSMNAASFDEISMQILSDVKNKIENRERFRADLERMRTTLIQLKEKRDHSESILTYYKEYINKCLQNMKQMSLTRSSDRRLHPGIRYTAQQLKQKGVLISIKDMDRERRKMKDIVFEINQMPEEVGLFLLRIKYKGMEWERAKIELQFLLELQYKSITHLDISDRTRVSVHPLIYLLDKKFFSL